MLRRYWLLSLLLLPLFANSETMELWSDNKEALAVCVNGKANRCYIAIGSTQVDVSKVETANLGKLGLRPRNAYSTIINFPTKWLRAGDNEYVVNITTQAWFEGQRYTITEPVYVKDGVYHQR